MFYERYIPYMIGLLLGNRFDKPLITPLMTSVGQLISAMHSTGKSEHLNILLFNFNGVSLLN